MITLRQLRLLSEAVSEAECWRGNLVGCAPQEALDAFDQRIAAMRNAVKAARADRAKLKAIKLASMYAHNPFDAEGKAQQ